MTLPAHVQSSLAYYELSLVKRENHLYCLVDLNTGEWYEKMTIFYILKLLNNWNKQRRSFP